MYFGVFCVAIQHCFINYLGYFVFAFTLFALFHRKRNSNTGRFWLVLTMSKRKTVVLIISKFLSPDVLVSNLMETDQ